MNKYKLRGSMGGRIVSEQSNMQEIEKTKDTRNTVPIKIIQIDMQEMENRIVTMFVKEDDPIFMKHLEEERRDD